MQKTRFEEFYSLNLIIKKLIPDANNEFIFTSRKETIKFLDNLFKTTKDLKYYFEKINQITNLFSKDEMDLIFYSIYKEQITLNPDDETSIRKFLETRFYKLDPVLTNKISTFFKGYIWLSPSVSEILPQCTSLNEILHLEHAYINNSERFYTEVPIIFQDKNFEGSPLNLRNKDSILGRNLIESLKTVSLGFTEICVFENKILIMIRDKGHALTIDIEEENGLYYINYHIPKLCNEKMIEKLKGIKSINKSSNAALGSFVSSEETILEDLTEFIKSVPTDADMLDIFSSKMKG